MADDEILTCLLISDTEEDKNNEQNMLKNGSCPVMSSERHLPLPLNVELNLELHGLPEDFGVTEPVKIQGIPIIQLFEPDCDNPQILDDNSTLNEHLSLASSDDCESLDLQCNPNLLCVPNANEICVSFRNYNIKDTDGICDTFLQPLKVNEYDSGEYTTNLSVVHEHQVWYRK